MHHAPGLAPGLSPCSRPGCSPPCLEPAHPSTWTPSGGPTPPAEARPWRPLRTITFAASVVAAGEETVLAPGFYHDVVNGEHFPIRLLRSSIRGAGPDLTEISERGGPSGEALMEGPWSQERVVEGIRFNRGSCGIHRTVAAVRGNTFSNLGTGLHLITGAAREIDGNRFEGNNVGISWYDQWNSPDACPVMVDETPVTNSVFVGNGIGLDIDLWIPFESLCFGNWEFRQRVVNNTFAWNSAGLAFHGSAFPSVENNVFSFNTDSGMTGSVGLGDRARRAANLFHGNTTAHIRRSTGTVHDLFTTLEGVNAYHDQGFPAIGGDPLFASEARETFTSAEARPASTRPTVRSRPSATSTAMRSPSMAMATASPERTAEPTSGGASSARLASSPGVARAGPATPAGPSFPERLGQDSFEPWARPARSGADLRFARFDGLTWTDVAVA